ncbi:hypothetical protein AB0H43_28550 [Hamadaea sp. NPDC050747]|uniref:hypothetical protein n=1 Tax=Hamadaea sp. NPDC050747 TaxID=3155789 RepID=UPI0033DEB3A8
MTEVVAADYTVVIDVNTTTVGFTTVKYDFEGHSYALWHRYVGLPGQPGVPQPWRKVSLLEKLLDTYPDPTPQQQQRAEHEGRFTSAPIHPGQQLEYGIMMDPDLDPNVGALAGEMVSRITIIGLGEHTDADWIGDEYIDIGGTYYFHQLDTFPHGATVLRLQIGADPPVRDAYGQNIVAQPLVTVWSPYGGNHAVEAKPLLPGNVYFATILIVDTTTGQWTERDPNPFRTKRRRIELRFPVIEVVNDGDPAGSGEAEFAVAVFEGRSNGPVVRVDGRQLGDDDNPRDVSTGDWFATNMTPIVIGPKVVTPDFAEVWVVASGTEYDGIGESNEHASSEPYAPGFLPMPVGRGLETVNLQGLTYTARPWASGDDFAFRLYMNYDITYWS